ncbi:HAUS augmin-like complex subunit 6 [Lingula anatina]|uniref:HAUS augmin-like complex subunit 6 n=1 Tax=Lingula anatina TaxID=7574 RepID=A0A2R2MSK2_LINAN|nr:HAUS augmin-like complex subunit 6 [Lingula anatina]|eukprot:XP_023933108.1 HAUS augmin-like complex subunit 6 [Lingula anatina]
MEHSWELEAKKPLGVSLDPTDMRQVFFTNLLLLGFDTGAMESQYKIPFNRDMFALPNKKAFEVVMYFLFNKLDPVLCRETFRDCWPVIDKKVEQLFRKACNNWLTMIAKVIEEKDAHLPRIVASTFMSPGGDRFYQLMFNFSRYVILRTIKNDHGLKTRDMLQHPVLTPQNLAIDHVISESLKCGAVRHRKRFLEHVEDTVQVQQQWKEYASLDPVELNQLSTLLCFSELVKDNRTLSKAVRDKERLVRDEIQKGTTLGGSPVPKRRSGIHDPALDVQSVKRAQKVQKVRELWKILDDFNGSKEQECEVIESILHGTLDQYKIDAGEINVKIPDLLLRECESELQRRNVDNTLKGGKLNLLSLVHLWNLSLHLYIEKLHTAGVPNFGDHLATVATQVHTHHAYLSNTQALRSKLAKELIPNLKASIDQLKHSLDQQPVTGRTPHGIRTASLGLGLLPPTPPISFQEDSTLTEGTPPNISTTLTPNKVSTPEAVSRLVNSVEKTVRREQASLGAGTPLYGPKLGIKGQPYGADNVPMSHLPIPVVQVERVGNKQRTRIRSAPGTPGASRGTLAGTSPLVMDSRNGVNTMFETLEMETTQEGRSTRESAREKLTEQVSKSKPGFKSKQRDKTTVNTRRPQSQTPRVERHSTRTSPRAHDILADKIADAVMDSSRKYTSGLSSGESTPDSMNMADLNLQDPLEGLGTKAFISQDKIARTPEGGHTKKMTWHDTLMEEQLPRRPSSTELDEVTKNLFTPENSDEENIITVGEVPDEKKDALSPVAKANPNQPKGATPSSKRKPKHSPTLLDMETVVGGQTLNRSAREAEERLEAASEVTNLLNDLTFNGGTVQEDMTWRKQSSSSDQSSSIVSSVVQRQDKSFRDSPISTEDQYRALFESKTPHLPNRAKRQNVASQDYSATPEFPKSPDHSRKSNPSVTPISTNDMPFGQFTEDGVQRSSAFSGYPKDLLSFDDEDDLLTTVTMPFSPSMEDSPHVGPQDVRMVVSPHVFGRKEKQTELGSEKRNYDEQKSSRSNARSPAASSTGSSLVNS